MPYFPTISRPPKTLTRDEQRRLLEVTGRSWDSFRDHVIYSLALATGLREQEIAALNVGDVFDEAGQPRRRIILTVYKRCQLDRAGQDVLVAQAVREKLARFRAWKLAERESLEPGAPLFVSRQGKRISLRQLRHAFTVWQERAGFDRHRSFHSARHAAVHNFYSTTRDIRLTQRFARHASLLTTMVYTHPTDDQLAEAVEAMAG